MQSTLCFGRFRPDPNQLALPMSAAKAKLEEIDGNSEGKYRDEKHDHEADHDPPSRQKVLIA
jgi:hypothetical protein